PVYSEIEVKKGEIQEIFSLDGKVQPQDSADLGFEIGGKIVKLNFEVGDSVKAGTILANVNAADLQAEYRAAQALAKSARANVEQYDELLKKEKAKLDSLKKTSTANSADKRAQKRQIEASEAEVAVQEAQLEAAFENAKAAGAQIPKTAVAAPFDGIISKQDVKTGEVVQADAPIITLISPDSFKIEAFASEIDVNKIRIGDSAQITLDDQPGKNFAAKIVAIDPAESTVNNVSNYKITLNFSENVENLRSGVGANVSVVSKNKGGVLVVPKDAIFEESGKKYVYASKNGLRVKAKVQTGINGSNNTIEIVSGLVEGDKLFVPGK
ncbi:MAG: efflux RND transporter periplasmic adaptor subunit, partial [Candidatus Moranbacteria bacterium]|nr:efflux RND transporter periplasmic adaptor subunit [Candidatus Moranbacteria bacterium]